MPSGVQLTTVPDLAGQHHGILLEHATNAGSTAAASAAGAGAASAAAATAGSSSLGVHLLSVNVSEAVDEWNEFIHVFR